jgi:transcriptional regulator with XRE-family HTH domain
MSAPTLSTKRTSQVGALLQYWRAQRGMSQFALALEADVSPRHVSFVETGRAQPSREMVLQLATALRIPLRERNALLLAAGYAPMYRESQLDAPELRAVRDALDAILAKQEPYPAVVMNRRWDILMTNNAATGSFSFLMGDRPMPAPANVVRLMFDPAGLRPTVANWEEVAEALVARVYREAVGGVPDDATSALLRDVLAMPGVPRANPSVSPLVPVIPIGFAKDGKRFTFFSAVTTLGTPQDVTLQEVRIESFFPLDTETTINLGVLANHKSDF